MRKLLFLSAFLSFFIFSFANSVSTTVKPLLNAKEIFIPVGKTSKMISLYDLSVIKTRDMQTLLGVRMSLVDKASFKIAQHELRNSMNDDGKIINKKFEKLYKKMSANGETGFHAGGFVLGLLLGLIGVLIAYLIKDDKKRNRVKWAWIGWALWVVIYLAILL
ncbi:MAG: hypothetical protein JSU05_14110 [Bacteroidetes bacterium]|nr:hypothetical protein [Bacteroidota bacterium]